MCISKKKIRDFSKFRILKPRNRRMPNVCHLLFSGPCECACAYLKLAVISAYVPCAFRFLCHLTYICVSNIFISYMVVFVTEKAQCP